MCQNTPINKEFKQNENWNKKLLVIGGLLLLMLIPLGMVNGVIKERQNNKSTAIDAISNAWARKQIVVGPVLSIPVKTIEKNVNGIITTNTDYINIFPTDLDIQGEIIPEIRYKGIFEHPVYLSDIKINGYFSDINVKNVSPENILWKDAFIILGITDQKGISKKPELLWNNEVTDFIPGTNKQNYIGKGIHSFVKVFGQNKKIPFSVSLTLKGSDSLLFVPIAEENKISLSSPWENPSFIGNFIPITKNISKDGFNAQWNISKFAFDYGSINPEWDSAFGVSLLLPVDSYRNTLRACKYGILFIALTFLACFLFEVVGKLRIHPFQYSLVGIALVIFYLLLISFSEFIGFMFAYIIASIATISLISLYTHFSLTKKLKPVFTGVMTITLVLLYSYLYILLQLQDTPLLLGSIGAFLALSALMYFTKDINWYEN